MAVYFDNRIQSSSVTANTDLLWHSSYALLAVASENAAGVGGSVNFFLDEGELLEESSIQRSSLVSSMSWHPVRKIIGVGWASGELLMWNEHDRELHEVYSIHKVKINTTLWSQSGHRLVTGDEEGLLAIWKADTKGRLSQTPLYQHNCGSAITYCLFKPPHTQDNAIDMAGLARAAVNGDEKALDMFSWTKGPKLSSSSSANSFFFGTADGSVFHVDDKGHSTSSFAVDGRVKTLLYYEGKDVLVTVTENMMLTQHTIEPDGTTNEIMKVKISGGSGNSFIIWAGQGVLATSSGEAVVRILDLDHDDNYVLSLDTGGYDNGECITCIAYAKGKGILAGGTNMGKVAMWHAVKHKSNVDGEKRWELFPPSIIQEPVLQLQWGGGKGLLGVNVGSSVVILNEQVMNVHFNDMVAAIQISPSQLTIENFATDYCQDLKTDIHIKGVYIIKDHAIVWDGKRVVVYEVSTNATLVRAAGSFASDSLAVVAHDQSVYTVEPGKIQVRNVQGTVKQLLAFHESEGDPVLIDVCGSFLVSGTSLGYIKMWDLSRREAKQHGPCKSFEAGIPGVGKIKSVKINCNGTKVCVICEKDESTNDPRLFIWDVDLDLIQCFDFFTGRNDHAIENEGNERSLEVSGRYPTIQYWDPNEPKLLVCQAVLAPLSSTVDSGENGYEKASGESNDMNPDVIIVTLFSTPENGIILLDHFPEEEEYTGFLGLQVPYLYFAIKRIEAPEEKKGAGGSFVPLGPRRMATKRTMRDFVGLEDASAEAKQAMINFSYLSAIGNMDEAFKAIKLIKSESVWENMSRMCVKTKRLDVASVCLGNMKNARAAKALRKAMKEPEHDARVAMLAIQLNMLDEGEKLYKSCKRFDLLNKFYQARNEWSKAIEVAELHDRVHLRTTYYNFAKFLESSGNVQEAIANYEKSDTFRFEVPRMLLENPDQLESYIMKTKDKSLRKWWAQYMESNSEMEVALKYYEAANDILSLVRVYCFCGNIEKASEICNETGDRAASYHLARQFENQDSIREAIHFYTRAQCYSNAIRLAKENGLDNELMNLALLSKPQDMIDVARYYENVPDMLDKAVILYHKGGEISKALDLCFKTEQFSALQVVAEDLTENTDPEMLTRCSEFFMQHGQYDKAVDLAVLGKKYAEAMDLCLTHNVIITEELAEKMTLPKDSNNSELRNKILERIAECCMQQGSYHMATKKFTQAGNKVKAMKALLKSGDTEKIVFFAGVSRQREIYVMAANYLQSLDWRKDPDIMKNIIGFYTKGRALDSLATFYDACAQVEIDEYQNYEKALGALSESYKCLGKAKLKDSSNQEEKMAFIKQRIGLIKKFIQAKRSYEEDAQEAMKQCQILIEEPDLEAAVRIGDVYGIMIEQLAREENYSKAYSLMQDLRQRMPNANMSFYVNMRTIEVIHKSLDIPLGRGMGGDDKPVMNGGGGSEDEGEELEEELEEEVREDLQNGYD